MRPFREKIEKYHQNKDVNLVIVNEYHHFDNNSYSENITGRIFRRRDDICYRGNIHEMLFIGDRHLSGPAEKDIIIHHSGYTADKQAKKSDRNLRILEKNLAEGKIGDYLYVTLAMEYSKFNRHDDAYKMALLAKKRDLQYGSNYNMAINPCLLIIEYMLNNADSFDWEEIQMEIEQAQRRFAKHPELDYWQGKKYWLQGEQQQALQAFQHCLQNVDYNGDQAVDVRRKLPLCQWYIAHIYAGEQNFAAAVEYMINYFIMIKMLPVAEMHDLRAWSEKINMPWDYIKQRLNSINNGCE